MGKPTFDNGTPRPCVVFERRAGSDFRYHEKVSNPEFIGVLKLTRGTETSQYLEERTSTETPLVVASERGRGQWLLRTQPEPLGMAGMMGDSPVRVQVREVLE